MTPNISSVANDSNLKCEVNMKQKTSSEAEAMPSYDWTCLACGRANEAYSSACSECSCGSSASLKQITKCRENYVASGRKILPGAGKLSEETDYEILTLFAKMILAAIGIVTFVPKKK